MSPLPATRASILAPAVAAILIACGGCSGIRLQRTLNDQAGDWPVFAGSESHPNASPRTLRPPLSLDWTYDLSAGGGNGSPIVIDSTVIVGNLRGELHAVNERSGKRLGWISLGDAIQGSPAIVGRLAIVALTNSAQSLVAYNLDDGTYLWKRDYGDIEVTPLVLDRRIYFGNLEGAFFCVDRATGDQVWKFELPDNRRLLGFRSSPAAEDSTVVAGADDGNVYAFQAATGAVLWRVRGAAEVVAPPSIHGRTVFSGNLRGEVTATDLATGTVRWKFETSSPIYGLIALTDRLALFGTLAGTVYALRQQDGSIEWKQDVEYPVNTGILIAGDVAYVASLKRTLFALDMQDGKILWRQEVNGRLKTTPAMAGDRLFVITDERQLLSFRESAP